MWIDFENRLTLFIVFVAMTSPTPSSLPHPSPSTDDNNELSELLKRWVLALLRAVYGHVSVPLMTWY